MRELGPALAKVGGDDPDSMVWCGKVPIKNLLELTAGMFTEFGMNMPALIRPEPDDETGEISNISMFDATVGFLRPEVPADRSVGVWTAKLCPDPMGKPLVALAFAIGTDNASALVRSANKINRLGR